MEFGRLLDVTLGSVHATDSFWISGYFRESMIQHIKVGDPALATLMTYPDTPITGTVESIGWDYDKLTFQGLQNQSIDFKQPPCSNQ